LVEGFVALSIGNCHFVSFSRLQAQGKQPLSGPLKIGFLMDSLKVERWQTDLDRFQKRAAELGADVLV